MRQYTLRSSQAHLDLAHRTQPHRLPRTHLLPACMTEDFGCLIPRAIAKAGRSPTSARTATFTTRITSPTAHVDWLPVRACRVCQPKSKAPTPEGSHPAHATSHSLAWCHRRCRSQTPYHAAHPLSPHHTHAFHTFIHALILAEASAAASISTAVPIMSA